MTLKATDDADSLGMVFESPSESAPSKPARARRMKSALTLRGGPSGRVRDEAHGH